MHQNVMAQAPTRAARASRLTAPIDAASLAVFRIAFGATMCVEVARFFSNDWIRRYYMAPSFHFHYYGFEWINPWPGGGMIAHFVVLGAASALIAAGLWYRLAAAVFAAAFTYVFLLEQARYLNHFYLISLLGFLLIVVPADRVWSLGRRASSGATVPVWTLWLLRFQIGVAYFYAGVAKLNPDWLRGEPLRAWMAASADLPIVGKFLLYEPTVYLFVYGGLLFDLLIVPALLWRRTRPFAFVLACAFHLMNTQLFSIGVFPYLMIFATTLFFEPAWPRRFFRNVKGEFARPPLEQDRVFTLPAVARIGLAVYVALQLCVPLRHWWYPGDVNWTEEGHRFSWRMKLRDKDAEATFIAVDPVTLKRDEVDLRPYLTSWQYNEMAGRPDMILQLAHRLADDIERQSGQRPDIRAIVWASLNGRPREMMIDPLVDLAEVPRSLQPASWIRRLR